MNPSRRALGAALACAPLARFSHAQSFPDRPIRMILPFVVGGGTDVVGRLIAKGLSDRLGQQVIVENRPGAGSTIGTSAVAKAVPDGYTLLFASAAHSFSPSVYRVLPYSQDDFTAIAIINSTPLMVAAHPSVPARDLKSFIALLKENPGKYSYGSSGKGTTLHIAAEHFNMAAGVNVLHVPYKGEAPAMTDLLGGQIHYMVGQASTAAPHVKAGKLIGIGVTTPRRVTAMSDIPTIAEGGLPGWSAYGWNAVLAPRSTPRSIIEFLNREINAVIAGPDIKTGFDKLGLDYVDPTTPESATVFIANETAKWAPVIRAAGVQE